MKMDHLVVLVFIPALLAANPVSNINSSSEANTSTTLTDRSAPELSSPTEIIMTREPVMVTLRDVLVRVKVIWEKTSPCQGRVYFYRNFTEKKPLCYSKALLTMGLDSDLCNDGRCGASTGFKNFSDETGYIINENLILTTEECTKVQITCKVSVDSKELVAYKAATGILLALILAVFLLNFARPAFMAFRKRFLQKPQDRWIGPTQSQSVSYHRGQQAGPNNNTMKRQSYPGLERLTVSNSREPSSNRNSDYDSYGF